MDEFVFSVVFFEKLLVFETILDISHALKMNAVAVEWWEKRKTFKSLLTSGSEYEFNQ